MTPELDRNKATVQRLVEEVLNGGRLDVIADLYAPEAAARAREWIAPFRASFPDVRMEIMELSTRRNLAATGSPEQDSNPGLLPMCRLWLWGNRRLRGSA